MNKYPDKTENLYDQSREMQLKQTLDELESELNKPIWKEFIEENTGFHKNS